MHLSPPPPEKAATLTKDPVTKSLRSDVIPRKEEHIKKSENTLSWTFGCETYPDLLMLVYFSHFIEARRFPHACRSLCPPLLQFSRYEKKQYSSEKPIWISHVEQHESR
jgi:hypothetical protein